MSKRGPKPMVLPVKAMAERFNHGESLRAIGLSLGISAHVVKKRLKESGLTFRQLGRRGGSLWLVSGYPIARSRGRKSCSIHRACWEAHNGPIPKGYDIHHINGNRMDYRIENLSCVPHGHHCKIPHRELRESRRFSEFVEAAIAGVL